MAKTIVAHAIGMVLIGSMVGAWAQDQGAPARMQQVGDQVVNGVLVQSGRLPVFADAGGRTGARPAPNTSADRSNQAELNELARLGRSETAQPPMASAQPAAQIRRNQGAQFDLNPGPGATGTRLPAADTAPPKAAAIVRKARSDDDELAALEKSVEQAQAELAKKQRQIQEKKRDEERRAEEARLAMEREVARQKLTFEVHTSQELSEAIAQYIAKNGWETLEWNAGPDYRVRKGYIERPQDGEAVLAVLLRVLKPYGLSARLHPANSTVDVYQNTESANRN